MEPSIDQDQDAIAMNEPVKRKRGRPKGTTKKNLAQRLNDALNTGAELVQQHAAKQEILPPATSAPPIPIASGTGTAFTSAELLKQSKDIKNDYEYSRVTLYGLIEKGNHAIDGLTSLAEDGQQPRAYEVIANLIGTVKDVTKELLALHKMMRDLAATDETEKKKGNNATVNGDQINTEQHIHFVGSPADLLKIMDDRNNSANQKMNTPK